MSKHPKYRGVYENSDNPFNPYRKAKWVVCITAYGKTRNLLYTDDDVKAARNYDKWAKYYKGDEAELNFPEEV